MPKKSETAPEATTNTGPVPATMTPVGEPAPGPAVPAQAAAGDTPTPPPEVSAAASALGRRARGVPKTLTEERREELREAAAHARGFRVRAQPTNEAPVPPTTGRRIRPDPVAPAGRRVRAIVAPTKSEVDAFGGRR